MSSAVVTPTGVYRSGVVLETFAAPRALTRPEGLATPLLLDKHRRFTEASTIILLTSSAIRFCKRERRPGDRDFRACSLMAISPNSRTRGRLSQASNRGVSSSGGCGDERHRFFILLFNIAREFEDW